MTKYYLLFFLSLIAVFVLDQNIKFLFVSGLYWDTECISLSLTFNKGVAFSMLSWLGESLKYIQIVLVSAIIGYVLFKKDILRHYALAAGMLTGAAFSNIFDRFLHGGVVDYVHWHCGFDFAVFNLADVVIDISVLMILYIHYKLEKKASKDTD